MHFFYLGVSVLKPNIRKKGTLIIKGLLGSLDRITVQGLRVRRGFGLGGFKFEGSREVKKLQELLGWASGLGYC